MNIYNRYDRNQRITDGHSKSYIIALTYAFCIRDKR